MSQASAKILFWAHDAMTSARYFKLEITERQRSAETDYVQMSIFDFIDRDGNRFAFSSDADIVEDLTTDKRKRGISTEYPARLLDGVTSTRWCCYGAVPYILVFDLGESAKLDLLTYNRYQWYTANDSIEHERNPKSWNVYVSNDLERWRLLDSVEGFVTSVGNQKLAYTSEEFSV